MPIPIRTLRDINVANARFWKARRESFYEKLANNAIRETAAEFWQAEWLRTAPLVDQFAFEKALEDAERIGRRFQSQFSSKGGTARKGDALQLLIEQIAQRQPDISVIQLLEKLQVCQGTRHIIQSIEDGVIIVATNSGKVKEVPVSGLKHRLSRAKKRLKSR